MLGDAERERKVHAGANAGRRVDVTVFDPDRRGIDGDVPVTSRQLFGKRPMCRRAATSQQTRVREDECADTADPRRRTRARSTNHARNAGSMFASAPETSSVSIGSRTSS